MAPLTVLVLVASLICFCSGSSSQQCLQLYCSEVVQLQSVEAQVGSTEQLVSDLQSDLAAALDEVNDLNSKVAKLESQVEQLIEVVNGLDGGNDTGTTLKWSLYNVGDSYELEANDCQYVEAVLTVGNVNTVGSISSLYVLNVNNDPVNNGSMGCMSPNEALVGLQAGTNGISSKTFILSDVWDNGAVLTALPCNDDYDDGVYLGPEQAGSVVPTLDLYCFA